MQIHILAEGLFLGMDLKDFLASLHVGTSHCYLPVKTARTKDSRVQDIHAVGGRHDDNAFIDAKAVHLNQQLVQRLLPLIVAAAHTCTSAAGNRVNLINKHDTGRVLLGLLEQITDTGSAHAHEHLHKIRT